MKLESITHLTPTQKQQLFKLWNTAYPHCIAYKELSELEAYLHKLEEVRHTLLIDDNNMINGWFFEFNRDGGRWFAMMLHPEVQGKGWGSRLLSKAKEENNELNGWVIEKEDYPMAVGGLYRSAMEFYRKNGFAIQDDIRFKTPVLSTVKIRWERNS